MDLSVCSVGSTVRPSKVYSTAGTKIDAAALLNLGSVHPISLQGSEGHFSVGEDPAIPSMRVFSRAFLAYLLTKDFHHQQRHYFDSFWS
jgi:hypothetical protein